MRTFVGQEGDAAMGLSVGMAALIAGVALIAIAVIFGRSKRRLADRTGLSTRCAASWFPPFVLSKHGSFLFLPNGTLMVETWVGCYEFVPGFSTNLGAGNVDGREL